MNEEIRNEMILMMSVNENIKGSEQIKIISVLSSMMSNVLYNYELKKALDPIISDEKFSLSDVPKLILLIIDVNKKFDFYKVVNEERVKYILWGLLYSFLLKNHTDKLNLLGVSEIRILYINTAELLLLIPQSIKIQKENWGSCLGRSISFFKCLDDKNPF
jgi:hypothetical protein